MGTSSLPSVASPQCLPSVGRVPVCNCGFFSLVFLFTVSPASLRGLRAASKLVCSHFEHSSWFTADVFHLSVCHLSGVRSQLLGRVRPFVTPWTVAHQAPLSMGFFQARTLEWIAVSSSRIFPTQGLNSRLLCLLHSRWILWPLSILAISKIPLPSS